MAARQRTHSVTPDEKGQRAVEATATAAELARNEHYLKLTGHAHVVGEGRTLDAAELRVEMTPDDKLIQSMALRRNSRITGGGGASGAQGMSRARYRPHLAPDGRTIQQSHLVENAAAAGRRRRRRAAGGGARHRSHDESHGLGDLRTPNANENVQLDLPAAADAPARRITSASLIAGPTG